MTYFKLFNYFILFIYLFTHGAPKSSLGIRFKALRCPWVPRRIRIWKCWSLWKEENWRTRSKTLGARTRTNNKLNPHMTSTPGIGHGHIAWWEASALATVPSLPPTPPPPNLTNQPLIVILYYAFVTNKLHL